VKRKRERYKTGKKIKDEKIESLSISLYPKGEVQGRIIV